MDRKLLLIILTLTMGCEADLSVRNRAPLVASVGPVLLNDQGNLDIRFSLWDAEEDPVAIEIEGCLGEVCDEGSDWFPLDPSLGGAGLQGLTSGADPGGMSHVLIWAPTTLPEALWVRITPQDREALGPTLASGPFFPLQSGSEI